MLDNMLSKKAIGAVATVGIAALVLSSVGAGTPVAVDEIDTQPDSMFYELERAGESIKAPFFDSVDYKSSLWEERIEEYVNMSEKGKAEKYMGLVEDAEKNIRDIAMHADNDYQMSTVENMVSVHTRVLKNVRDNIASENAREGLNNAIQRSERVRQRIRETIEKQGQDIGENKREELRRRLREIPAPGR